jgi:hypothetical protein
MQDACVPVTTGYVVVRLLIGLPQVPQQRSGALHRPAEVPKQILMIMCEQIK